jgi:hypothetical protein
MKVSHELIIAQQMTRSEEKEKGKMKMKLHNSSMINQTHFYFAGYLTNTETR